MAPARRAGGALRRGCPGGGSHPGEDARRNVRGTVRRRWEAVGPQQFAAPVHACCCMVRNNC
eukprot:15437067-Alexandrium_andersonii.AAC.1